MIKTVAHNGTQTCARNAEGRSSSPR